MRLAPVTVLLAFTLMLPVAAAHAATSTTSNDDAAHKKASETLAKLCNDFWEDNLITHPLAATGIGDHRYDDRLDDNSPKAIASEQKRLEGFLARAEKLSVEQLGPTGRIDRGALIEEVQGRLDRLSCHFELWNVSAMSGPQVTFMNLPDLTRFASTGDFQKYVTRCRAMPKYIDQHIANLKVGLAEGKVASEFGVRKVLDQLKALEAKEPADWPLLEPTTKAAPGVEPTVVESYQAPLTEVVATQVAPALKRYREFLEQDVLPKARPQDKAGLVALPGGSDSYRKLIHVHTSLDRSPEQLHQLGLDEVKRIRGELSVLGKKVLGTDDIVEIQKRLRTDPKMHFETAEQVEAKAGEALARARAAIPKYFGVLPKADCVVKVMGMHEAPQSTIAYYREPAKDGSRPGTYMINTYKPETRPRYEAEALAFHESIPGHHLQIAIAQELKDVPEFRKFEGVTAFVEGWGLYTERLADEMGLYSSDLDRIGMLSFDAWRACRLVVDTGMHAMGWSRQQAIDYMVANTVLAENNIVNEVDRYIGNPGQALAYKCGQLEILALREEAKQKLGARFDIKAFHDAVLENGAVALPVLREQIERWESGVLATP